MSRLFFSSLFLFSSSKFQMQDILGILYGLAFLCIFHFLIWTLDEEIMSFLLDLAPHIHDQLFFSHLFLYFCLLSKTSSNLLSFHLLLQLTYQKQFIWTTTLFSFEGGFTLCIENITTTLILILPNYDDINSLSIVVDKDWAMQCPLDVQLGNKVSLLNLSHASMD